jgi:phosphoglycolate phosphatase-like HAD superfamily hydrolase
LADRAGGPLDGVRELLGGIDGEPSAVSLLLTGNTRQGADAKLRHYHLDGYFSGGAFAEEGDVRADIARRAWALGDSLTDAPWRADEIVVIGDTPHDIAGGRAIGARTLAVATGRYDATDLAKYDPWRVLPRLPSAREFLLLVLEHDE